MFHVYRKELMWGGRRLVLETGKIARQADGAVLVSYGETTVLCTAVAMKAAKAGQDFFPLTVNYQEKTFAAGKIPGGFFKREGRPTERETLVSRLIDRPIRPLFPDGFRCDTQVIVTVLSHDLENDPDIVAMVAASAALTLSGVPFMGPVGAARVGYINGQYKLNPPLPEMEGTQLDLVVAGTHGAALFTRGETQALVVTTLGTGEDEQFIDELEGTRKEAFLLHYNFPPYSVGETGRLGSPGRREIGHGKLAWRAIHPMLPPAHEFPYTVRVVSEITESNGSSSMATVCGTSLALMDAGVPLRRPTAGIAMGLIKEDARFAVLSDILGDEDHLGDMDFKVAGTDQGITALQMDIKITSITREIMKIALDQAKDGRMHILGEMAKALTGAREAVSQNAPRITVINIPKDKIREVIGSGGKVIREIVEQTGAKIDIEDDGTVKVAAVDANAAQAAIDWIRNIVAEPGGGGIYDG